MQYSKVTTALAEILEHRDHGAASQEYWNSPAGKKYKRESAILRAAHRILLREGMVSIEPETPIAEFVNTREEFKWRMKWKNETSPWMDHFASILTCQFSNGETWALATSYWEGALPIEKPFRIVES